MRRVHALLILVLVLLAPASAAAQEAEEPGSDCGRAVVFTLPGVTWELVRDVGPPNLLALAGESSIGSMSVRTIASRTSPAAGYLTIGAGTRAADGGVQGGIDSRAEGRNAGPVLLEDVGAAGLEEIRMAAETADYHAVAGALGSALGERELLAIGNADRGLAPPAPGGLGRWTLLAAMDREGRVDAAAVSEDLLVPDSGAPYGVRTDESAFNAALDAAFARECASMVIDQGDLLRADELGRLLGAPRPGDLETALLAADGALGEVTRRLDAERDLLLVVSPTSPSWDEAVHLGVAIARGPGFASGSTLISASTRERGFVALTDIAPTILDVFDIERPASMLGRPIVAEPKGGDLIEWLVEMDRESTFAHSVQADIATTFVVFQIVIYVIALFLLGRTGSRKDVPSGAASDGRLTSLLGFAGLAIVAFPLATYLATPIDAHRLGLTVFSIVLVAIVVVIVALVSVLLSDSLERLLAITAATITVMIVDLVFLDMLQLNAVFGNSPIIAGRFSGLGNIAFSVLGATSLITGALMVHRWPGRPLVLAAVAALFVGTVIADGAPQLGSDVGGILALVPALGLTWLLLAGKRPTLKMLGVVSVAAVVALGLFLAADLARPPDSRTHLARLFEDVRARGGEVFVDTIGRKIRTNLRVFRSTIWTYLVPPALAVIAWLLLRPRGRWAELALIYPKLRAGLIGGLLLAVIGFSVNDSGIVVPAMVLSFLVPMTLLLHLSLEKAAGEEAS
jgi:hypothetical protein